MIPLRDSHPSRQFPYITVLLIVVNISVFYLEITGANPDALIYTFGLVPQNVSLTQIETWPPFLSAMFLHAGLLHIMSNVLFLWVFGDNVEERLGWFFLPFYLLGGIMGNFIQYLFMPTSDIPIIGASGAVAAVMGAYIVFFPHHRIKTLVPIFFFLTVIDIPALLMLGYWFALQLLSSYTAIIEATSSTGGGVAYFAHVGGFLWGLLVAWTIPRDFFDRQTQE